MVVEATLGAEGVRKSFDGGGSTSKATIGL